ncbi:hypothetical protein [Nonomuraea jiangxiensis]|uniref:Uncharacterized protein n=1 Tax=Nonomuraea jiangxiensis TaxID=633440 RepID=A0A1G9PB15_9ACTN|nr:hypothetical protein [Nonomuraea jiangxiensis]SDL95355.1 hypothetical protein SAMN05421869_13374 [Nonomuraea jiangxiensis]
MTERLIRTSYVDPTVNPPEPRQGDTGLHESRQDQEGYFGPLHRMHGSALHGWGVAAGLQVSATIGRPGLRVLPGVALDVRGRLLPLAVGGHVKPDEDTLIPVTETGVPLQTAVASGEYHLTIGWAETFDFTGVGSGVFNTETTPTLRLRQVNAPDDGEEVILAWVEIGADGVVVNTSADQRRTTGLSTDRITLLGSFDSFDAEPGTAVTVFDQQAAELRAFNTGGVILEASRVDITARSASSFLIVNPVARRMGVNTTVPGATLDVDGTTVLRGGVGIGTRNPQATLDVLGSTVLQRPPGPDPTVPQSTLDVRGFAQVRGFLGIGSASMPTTSLDVNGGAFIRGRVGVGRGGPRALVHAVDQGGFEAEDGEGKLTTSNIPLLAEARTDGQTAIGALNSNGRPAFALSIDEDGGTNNARGVPAFWDKYDGNWHLAFGIKNGNLAVGHRNPGARLHVVGGPTVNDVAVQVETQQAVGIWTFSEGGGIPLIIGGKPNAAWISGNVDVRGTLTKTDLRFKIDHPLDPAGRYLSHSGVESDEMKNVYDGEVVLDDRGAAEITLPDWFEALNERFRYQLTPIGAPAPNLYVASELSGNAFAVAGGEPGLKVCWQVTGVRHDAYALANPLVVETAKEAAEHGTYLHPEPHGAPAERALRWMPPLARQADQPPGT